MWKDLWAYLQLPIFGLSTHDVRVHDFKSIAARDLAQVELRMRHGRRLSHQAADPEALRQKLEDADRVRDEVRRMIGHHGDDDGDLLRGADAP